MTKLVAVVHGEAFGAYVDARPDSPTRGAVETVRLLPGTQVLVPQGVCNGFQVLCEAGLLPGALTRNEGLHFICRDVWLEVTATSTAWSSRYESGADILIPLKSGEGRYVASENVLDELEGEGRVVFRYRDNMNGSMRSIAGISSANGRVVGLMPHPEHAVEPGFGPDTAAGPRSGVDGLGFFTSVLTTLASRGGHA